MENDRNLKVIIIDDNDVIRELLRITLRSDGYEIIGEAADGEGGLLMVAKLKPDMVCLDIMMPKISGIDVLKRIKAILPHTAVLMITAKNDLATVKEVLAAGASGLILKPFNTGTVLSTMEKVASKLKS
jgi:two-component system, chemotaxis family, chemotaxis protein CheY